MMRVELEDRLNLPDLFDLKHKDGLNRRLLAYLGQSLQTCHVSSGS